MDKDQKDEYVALFQGVKLTKREANKVGLGLLFGFVGGIISLFLLGPENKVATGIICFIFVAIGYFLIGNKIFRK